MAASRRPWGDARRAIPPAIRDWLNSDGLIWLHLLKTITAGLLALGIAMLLDLPQPRIAMTTVFVLMQPFSGMVLAKSFYRILGTAVGTVAALMLGALFVQQTELYMLGIIAWVSACIAAAVRYRHFRWYGFVLAGYTAALIGIPNVTTPHDLFLAALTRAAEVAVGIVCSSAVSALIVPQRSSLALHARASDAVRQFYCVRCRCADSRHRARRSSSGALRISSTKSSASKRRAFSPLSKIPRCARAVSILAG